LNRSTISYRHPAKRSLQKTFIIDIVSFVKGKAQAGRSLGSFVYLFLKQFRRSLAVGVVISALATGFALIGAMAPQTFGLFGKVLGSSGKSVVYVALWQADGFLKRPVQQVRFEPGAELHFHFEVPAGRWAVSAFEDRNRNGVLDMGLFGPKEPSGFWRAFTGHHTPRFDEVASSIERDVQNADITLK
jgi:hypothetical protein